MAATALNIEGKKILVITTPDPVGLVVQIFDTEGDYKHVGKPESVVRSESEEEYHRNLRKDAHSKQHYIADRSTNPEWNPE